jgi:uncharacterized protein (DUF2235 family)
VPERLVLCCDGTWDTAGQERDGRLCPTNVAEVALGSTARTGTASSNGSTTGTRPGERIRGGAFGTGLSSDVQDAYRSVVEHYEPGDEPFVGFSRGAYTARSTVGLIRDCGVLRREHAGRLKEAYGPVVTARPPRTADGGRHGHARDTGAAAGSPARRWPRRRCGINRTPGLPMDWHRTAP